MKNRSFPFSKGKQLLLLLALTPILLIAPAHGDGDDHRWGRYYCALDGSWFISPTPNPFVPEALIGPHTLNVAMKSYRKGSGSIEWTGIEATFFDFCPESVELSTAQGPFTRTGPRSFEFTAITFSRDENENAVCIIKTNGWVELDRGCRTGTFNGIPELYRPDQNPFGDDDPFLVGTDIPDDYPVTRMTVDEPSPSM